MNTAQANAQRNARRRSATARAGRRAYAAMFAQAERRVMVCSTCGRSAAWEGWVAALLQGWAWEWKRARPVFLCPEQHAGAAKRPARRRTPSEAA